MEQQDELIEVPDFSGMQALNAWLAGHDRGLMLSGPEPDSPEPLINGVVRNQLPAPGTVLHRWDVVTVWIADAPPGGDREPREPVPPIPVLRADPT